MHSNAQHLNAFAFVNNPDSAPFSQLLASESLRVKSDTFLNPIVGSRGGRERTK